MPSEFPGRPRLLKGALIVFDAPIPVPTNIIIFQYNPEFDDAQAVAAGREPERRRPRCLPQRRRHPHRHAVAGGGIFAGGRAGRGRPARAEQLDQRRGRPASRPRRARAPALSGFGSGHPQQGADAVRQRFHHSAADAAGAVRVGRRACRAGAGHVGVDHRDRIRPDAQPDPGQGRPGDALAHGLRAQQGRPTVQHPRHHQPGRQGSDGALPARRNRRQAGSRRPSRACCRSERQSMFTQRSRYITVADAVYQGADGRAIRYKVLRITPDTKALQTHTVAAGRSPRPHRLPAIRRSRAVLAHLRRQRRIAAGRSDGRDRRARLQIPFVQR